MAARAPSEAGKGLTLPPAAPVSAKPREEGGTLCPSGGNPRPWSPSSQGSSLPWPLVPTGLIRICSKFFFSRNCPLNIFGTGFKRHFVKQIRRKDWHLPPEASH